MKGTSSLSKSRIDNDIEIIDRKQVRHTGMTKIATGRTTPFQSLLDRIHAEPALLETDQFARIARKIFHIPRVGEVTHSRLFSKNDLDIIDAWNDNCRRYFESTFAKKLLVWSLGPENLSPVLPLIKNMTDFLVGEYKKQSDNFLEMWNRAKTSSVEQNDESLDFFSAQRPDLVALINENHFSPSPSAALLNLYDLHYLVHHITRLDSYAVRHPAGIFEIYRRFSPGKTAPVAAPQEVYESPFNAHFSHSSAQNDPVYSSFTGSKHPLYRVANRGRIASNFGFCKMNPGFQLGILRNVDQTPFDFRKPSLASNVTRCPDRLYMSHPRYTRDNLNSWHQYCFANRYNSGLVLGMSGSTLLELRLLLFFISAVNDNYFFPESGDRKMLKKWSPEMIKKYFYLVFGMFVYFEGGHTFSEILTVFDIPEVRKGLRDLLPGNIVLSKQSLLFDNPDVMSLIRDSLIETVKFRSVLQAREALHEELLSRQDAVFGVARR